MDTWEKDGKKASKHFIRANTIQFLGGNSGEKKEGQSQDSPKQQSNSNSSYSSEEDVPF